MKAGVENKYRINNKDNVIKYMFTQIDFSMKTQ